MNAKKYLIVGGITLSFFAFFTASSFAQDELLKISCELGICFYNQGKYKEALREFHDVLNLDANNAVAKEYISRIFKKELSLPISPAASTSRQEFSQKKVAPTQVRPLPMPKTEVKVRLNEPKKPAEKNADLLKISGETQAAFGITPEDFLWKQANFDLNERNWRMLSTAAYDQRENTYDARIYDRFKINLDTTNEEGFGFHSNISIDPWSFTGKTRKTRIGEAGALSDYANVELKYWSNTSRTINETVYTLEDGAAISLPEIKVVDGKTAPTTVRTTWGANLTIQALKIEREFQPLRELWFDYKQEGLNLRFFPIAYQDQALTTDDPLRLSNNHTWWEESPWLDTWMPGRLNSGASPQDFTKGRWDDALSFFTRDSDGVRLTALRGFSFDFQPGEDTSFATTIASPKGLWQDYNVFDNFSSATRLKQRFGDKFMLGTTYTFRLGLNNETRNHKKDVTNQVLGTDIAYEFTKGLMLSLEAAQSSTKKDLTSAGYASKSRGNAYYASLIGRFPLQNIGDLKYGYDEIKPAEQEKHFTKFRIFASHMDEGFDPALSTYRETRDDAFWGRHLHFRSPFRYYLTGLSRSPLKWEDVEPFRIGNGIDIGRDVLGLRVQTSLWEKRIENLFDLRNVHHTGGKFMENVARDELTYKVNDRLTTKFLGLYQAMPKTKGNIDPFLVDTNTDISEINTKISDGQDADLKTGSLGAEYAFTDWLALNGIWERTNDYTLAYDNYPRGNLNDTSFITYREYDRVYRRESVFLYSQDLFPLPPYSFYNIFKSGLKITPLENLEIYLDYTRNEFKSAGQIDDNINHVGLEISYAPSKKVGLYTRYSYSRWNDLTLMRQGYSKYYLGHHNFFGEFRYFPTIDDEFVLQYGESGRSPSIIAITDPFGGGLLTLDTQHIFRLYYRRRF